MALSKIQTGLVDTNSISANELASTLDLSSDTVTLPDDVDAPVTLLHTGTYSGSATDIRWDLDNTNYRVFEVYFDDIVTSSDAILSVNYANASNGEPFGWYGGVYSIGESNTGGSHGAFSDQTECWLTDEVISSVLGIYHFSGKIVLQPNSARARITWHMVGRTSQGAQSWMGGGLTTDSTNAWPKFVLKSDQNITSVTYRIYGYK